MQLQMLGRQPLFQLLAAVIVLLVVDWQPLYGLAAAAVWIAWVAWSTLSPPASVLFAAPK
jgi:hypothetical protein